MWAWAHLNLIWICGPEPFLNWIWICIEFELVIFLPIKILLQLLWMLEIIHQSNWILEFELDTFFSICRKIFAAAATDQPPIKVNFGVSIGRIFFYFEEKLCCSCYGGYRPSTNSIEFWSLIWIYFSIFRKIFAAAAMEATDHPPSQLKFGVWIGCIFFYF